MIADHWELSRSLGAFKKYFLISGIKFKPKDLKLAMKFVVRNTSGENIPTLMRELGYHFWGQNKETGELAFTRPIGGLPFPRFHIWLRAGKKTGKIFFDLHLDQKKPIYKGVPAHSGEYTGEVVEKESERIKKFFLTLK